MLVATVLLATEFEPATWTYVKQSQSHVDDGEGVKIEELDHVAVQVEALV